MRFEGPPMNRIESKKESLDERWFSRLRKLTITEFTWLVGNKEHRNEQKKKFLNGEVENPDLDYPKINIEKIRERERELLELKEDIINNEENKVIRDVYRPKINEYIAQTRMLKCTAEGDDRRFARYSKFIYGEPDSEIFRYTLQELRSVVDENVFSADSEIRDAAQRLNAEFFEGFMFVDENEIRFPEHAKAKPAKKEGEERKYKAQEIRDEFEGSLLEMFYGESGMILSKDLFEGATEKGWKIKSISNPEASGEDLKEIVSRLRAQGWSVVVDKNIASITVLRGEGRIKIPEESALSPIQLKALIGHEIKTHVARTEKGRRSKLRILELGLDRYIRGEEGLATYAEQKIKGAESFSGFPGHLAIALASGLDGKKRDFRETFEVLKDYFFIKSKIKDKKEALKEAETLAWNRCVRTFRGTTCKTKGSCFTRDIVYREGNIGIWDVLTKNPQEERRFSVGKYDPANPRHIWILDQLGINDDDLNKLEEMNSRI